MRGGNVAYNTSIPHKHLSAREGCDVRFVRSYPPLINSVAETRFCVDVLRTMVGSGNVCDTLEPTMGAEDFAYMLLEKPGCYVWLGNGPGEGGCTLHNPHYDFNDDITALGISYWVSLTQDFLANKH